MICTVQRFEVFYKCLTRYTQIHLRDNSKTLSFILLMFLYPFFVIGIDLFSKFDAVIGRLRGRMETKFSVWIQKKNNKVFSFAFEDFDFVLYTYIWNVSFWKKGPSYKYIFQDIDIDNSFIDILSNVVCNLKSILNFWDT